MQEIEKEAIAESPEAVEELNTFRDYFKGKRNKYRGSSLESLFEELGELEEFKELTQKKIAEYDAQQEYCYAIVESIQNANPLNEKVMVVCLDENDAKEYLDKYQRMNRAWHIYYSLQKVRLVR